MNYIDLNFLIFRDSSFSLWEEFIFFTVLESMQLHVVNMSFLRMSHREEANNVTTFVTVFGFQMDFIHVEGDMALLVIKSWSQLS